MNSYYIIDNESNLDDNISNVMLDYPSFRSIGSSSNYEEAMNTILKRKPDIVFLNLDNVLDNAFQFVTELSTYLETIPNFVGISSTKASISFDCSSSGGGSNISSQVRLSRLQISSKT